MNKNFYGSEFAYIDFVVHSRSLEHIVERIVSNKLTQRAQDL